MPCQQDEAPASSGIMFKATVRQWMKLQQRTGNSTCCKDPQMTDNGNNFQKANAA